MKKISEYVQPNIEYLRLRRKQDQAQEAFMVNISPISTILYIQPKASAD
jgi:hypothetical protein